MKLVASSTFLFDLAPLGAGTCEVESLTSYLARLAHAHTMTPYQLLCTLDAWSRHKLSKIVPRFFSARVNGYSPNVRRLVQALESATGRTDIRSCTLIHLSEVCAKNNSDCIKLHRSWCPACLRESAEQGLILYDRLIWQIMGTSRCNIHRSRLEDSCALCGTKQHWQHSTSIDTCTFCGHALADAPQSSRILPPDPGERHLVELLEYTSGEKAQSFREEAAGVFIHHVSKHTDLQDAARRLGRVLRKAEHTRPSLCSLLYISEYFDVSSTLILTNPEKAAKVVALSIGRPRLPRKFRGTYLPRGTRQAAIERALTKEIESDGLAPSIRQFCNDNGFCETTVGERCSGLLKELVAKRSQQVASIRKSQICAIDRALSDKRLKQSFSNVREYLARVGQRAGCPVWLVRQRYMALNGDQKRRVRNGMLYMDVNIRTRA